MAISMMGHILALIFPIYVNIYKKDTMDLHRNTGINVKVQAGKDLPQDLFKNLSKGRSFEGYKA